MATFTADQLVMLRALMARNVAPQTWTKAQVNAALQALEDRLRLAGTQTTLSNDIEAAAPGIFTIQQKQTLFGVWCYTAAARLGIL